MILSVIIPFNCKIYVKLTIYGAIDNIVLLIYLEEGYLLSATESQWWCITSLDEIVLELSSLEMKYYLYLPVLIRVAK